MPLLSELTTRMADDRWSVAKMLDGDFKNLRSKRINVWSKILEIEIETGSSFLVSMPEGTPYLSVGITRDTFPIPRSGKGGDRFWAYMDRRYGMSEYEGQDGIARYVLGKARNYAMQHGSEVELRRFAAYKTKEGADVEGEAAIPRNETVYMSGYNGSMWRIDGENIMSIANGEDEIFFVDDDGGLPVEPRVGPNGLLFDKLINSISFAESGMGGISAEQMRMAYIIWIFGLAFPDLMPTKPLLILEGTPGAGKSLALQLLQQTLLGRAKPIILQRSKEDDFGVLLLRSPICVIDNLDAYVDWVPDAVCAYTTMGHWTKRKLFTDAEELILKPHAFLAVASKNPASFRREDVADRCVILRLERRERFTRAERLKREIADLRPLLLGEYMFYVNRIVAEIRAGAMKQQDDEGHRMADFAALARVVARVLDWEPDSVEDLLAAIQSEQAAFINEEDPLVDLLHKWIVLPQRGRTSIGREVNLFTLFHELESVAQANSIQFYKGGARTLAQKIRSPHVERDFIVQMMAPDGHKSYRIWRRSDGRLESVPMAPEEEPVVVGGGEEG